MLFISPWILILPLLLFWGWIFGVLYSHLDALGFNGARVYGCFPSIGLDDIDVAIKILHLVIVFCITFLE